MLGTGCHIHATGDPGRGRAPDPEAATVRVLVATSWPRAAALSARPAHLRRHLYRDTTCRARSRPSWGRWGLGSLRGLLGSLQGAEEFFAAAADLPVGKGPSARGATSEDAARRGEGQQLCPGLRHGGRGQGGQAEGGLGCSGRPESMQPKWPRRCFLHSKSC